MAYTIVLPLIDAFFSRERPSLRRMPTHPGRSPDRGPRGGMIERLDQDGDGRIARQEVEASDGGAFRRD